MGYGDRESVRRVRDALTERGVSPEFVELEETARSARDAAAALGCRVEQIVKSLVFRGADTDGPVLVLASGPNRVSEGRIPDLRVGEGGLRHRRRVAFGPRRGARHLSRRGPAARGGGVAAAGHTHVVFGLDPEELRRITAARAIRVK